MVSVDKNNNQIKVAPRIILVEPQLPENIGMTARAMANFGLTDLCLVKPREAFPCESSMRAASFATNIIEQARVFSSLEEALADLSFVYATTARQRYSYKIVTTPKQAMKRSFTRIAQKQTIGVMFGRERAGLSNVELSLADEIITFPVNSLASSLNLAQAVLLIGYEWIQAAAENEQNSVPSGLIIEPAKKQNLFNLFTYLEKALECRGYFRPVERKEKMIQNLRELLTRASFSEHELSLLRGVLSSLHNFAPKGEKL